VVWSVEPIECIIVGVFPLMLMVPAGRQFGALAAFSVFVLFDSCVLIYKRLVDRMDRFLFLVIFTVERRSLGALRCCSRQA